MRRAQLLRVGLTRWRAFCTELLTLGVSIARLRRVEASRAFNAWRANVQRSLASQCTLLLAFASWRGGPLRRAFNSWRAWLLRRLERSLARGFRARCTLRLLSDAVGCWSHASAAVALR